MSDVPKSQLVSKMIAPRKGTYHIRKIDERKKREENDKRAEEIAGEMSDKCQIKESGTSNSNRMEKE